jgi:hypothetical protein
MKKLLASTALMFGAFCVTAAFAQLSTRGGASGTIQYSVAVCDPNSPFHCTAPNASGNIPVVGTVTVSPVTGTYTSKNVALTLGGTSQTLMASNTSRKRIYIQNPCTATGEGIAAVESIYISFTGAAGVNNGTSIEILACGSYDSDNGPISTQAITVNAATTGHKIVAGEM